MESRPVGLWQFLQECLGLSPVKNKALMLGLRILWTPCCRVQPTHEVSNVGHAFISSLEPGITNAPTDCHWRLGSRKHPRNEGLFYMLCISVYWQLPHSPHCSCWSPICLFWRLHQIRGDWKTACLFTRWFWSSCCRRLKASLFPSWKLL